MRILAIPGSIRRESHNLKLVREARRVAEEGLDVVIFSGLAALPHYSEDEEREPLPSSVRELRGAIAEADGLLFATPEYNGTIPGVLKNAVDWASRPVESPVLRNKPVAVIGASTGAFGAVWAQAELRKSLGIAGARVIDAELAVSMADSAFDENGQLKDPAQREQLESVLGALRDAVHERAALSRA
jgi:chromate reductase